LKNLYVVYLYRSSDLEHGLVQIATQMALLTRKSSKIDQNAHIAPEPIQRVFFDFDRAFLHHLLTTYPPESANDHCRRPFLGREQARICKGAGSRSSWPTRP
jgi:hypothetical protein